MNSDISEQAYQKNYSQYVDFENVIQGEYALIGKHIAKLIESIFQFGSKLQVLDVGCGTGRMSNTLVSLLPNHNFLFDYLDPVESSLEIYASEVLDENRGQGFLSDWVNFKTATTYDLILANNSLCGFDVSEIGRAHV